MNEKNGETLRIERPGTQPVIKVEAEVTYDVRRQTEVNRKNLETNLGLRKAEKIEDMEETHFLDTFFK